MVTLYIASVFLWTCALPDSGSYEIPQADTLFALPELTVTATRTELHLLDSPARLTVIPLETIRRFGHRTLADALESHSGVFVRRYGAGGLANLSVRGMTPSQTLILIDGQRVASPQNGVVDLSLLPSILLQSVEIMSGAGSALYGADGMGGVVNLRTLGVESATRAEALAEVGAYGDQRVGFRATGRRGLIGGVIAVESEAATGDFPYLDRTRIPPRVRFRENADRTGHTIYGSVGLLGARSRITVSGLYNSFDRGLPGPASGRSQDERQSDENLRLWLNSRTPLGNGSVSATALHQRSSLRYLNPATAIDQTGHAEVLSAELATRQVLVPGILLGAGITASHSAAEHPRLSRNAAEYQAAGFLHADIELGAGRLFPSLRYDEHRSADGAAGRFAAISPRLGVNWRLSDRMPFRFKSSAGHSFRAPTFNDRFWQPAGRPDIHPERGWTFDAGFVVGASEHIAEVTYQQAIIRDQIVWTPQGGEWSPQNLTRVRSRGLEASYQYVLSPGGAWMISGAVYYSLTHTVDRSDPASRSFNQQVRYVPRHAARSSLALAWRRFNTGISGRYVSRRSITTDASQSLSSYFHVDGSIGAAYDLPFITARLDLFVKNVLDADYAVIQHYPVAPRHARIRITIQTR